MFEQTRKSPPENRRARQEKEGRYFTYSTSSWAVPPMDTERQLSMYQVP